jgi:hypothetical protein
VADCYNHRANAGNRYIVNPPGADARVHQHNEIGNGDIDWDQTFAALRDVSFDGIAAVCVFGWEEDADAIHRRMLETLTSALGPGARVTVTPGGRRRLTPRRSVLNDGHGRWRVKQVRPVRIGLVGYGKGGRFFHAPLIAAAVGCELAGVVTRSAERRGELERDLPSTPVHNDLAQLAVAGVDAVAISTTADTHVPLAGKPSRSGCRWCAISHSPFSSPPPGRRLRRRSEPGAADDVPEPPFRRRSAHRPGRDRFRGSGTGHAF